MTNEPFWAVIGGDTLLGRDLRELLGRSSTPKLKLIASSAEVDAAASEGRDDLFEVMNKADLEQAEIAFLAGSAESSRQAWALLGGDGPKLIDLHGTLEDEPSARLRAPWLEPEGFTVPPGAVQVLAHPAAIAIAMILRRLHGKHAVRTAVVQIFEPASERGSAGLHELQQQTVGLLSFKPLNKAVFDAQAAFNLLPRYGEDAPAKLEEIELRIDRHLATLLTNCGAGPMPSLKLVQAPVFHGYSFSVWLEFEKNPGPKALGEALACARIEVRDDDVEPPTNAGAAGQSEITVGMIAVDRNQPRACWLWAVADNLRLTAECAVEVANTL